MPTIRTVDGRRGSGAAWTEVADQLAGVEEPLRIPGRPVVIGPVGDPEHPVVGLGRLMEERRDSRAGLVHPAGLPVIGGDVPARRLGWPGRWPGGPVGHLGPQLTRIIADTHGHQRLLGQPLNGQMGALPSS
jgi:hypothetical protein